MVTLNCAVVGDAGSAFPVDIDKDKLVGHLKKAIAEDQKYDFAASKLRLFLAKKDGGRGPWLDWAGAAAVTLYEHGNPEGFVQMDPLLSLKNAKYFGDNFQPGEGQVHVLAVLPEGASGTEAIPKPKLTSFGMMLKQCIVSGALPQQGDFLKLFEWTDDDCGKVMDIKVIEDIVHFTGSKFYDEFDKGEVVNKQFILMGSPGTGKSCILALICFYIAVHYKRPVVWLRRVSGGIYRTATRLFYQGKYYEWYDDNGKIFESLYDAMEASGIDPIKCWFCLDGMVEREVKEKNWYNRYKLLATSGQFSPKSEAMQFTKRCLVPYWKQRDLEDFGFNHVQMQENDIDARLFVSGGSLRDFLEDNGKDIIKAAVANIAGPGDAEMLLTTSGVSSKKQIDRIRMQGVQHLTNTEHYVDTDKWRCCITSKFALHRLAAMMKPNFFEKLMGIAKGMNDDRLEGVAFEGYFHSSVRHQRPIQVQYFKYDNVNRRTVQDWETIVHEEMGTIKVDETPVVKCEGGNIRECTTVMESWAANPSTMDYWIPATSLCETIDAVAKWKFHDKVARFCFLQLTKATTHKCDAAILWKLAQPFVNKQLPVCYIALLPDDPDEDKRRRFRLNPAVITQQTVLEHIRLYVARFQVTHENINTTSS